MSERRPYILFVLPQYAAFPDTGAGQRSIMLYRALRKIGNVDLFLMGDHPLELITPQFTDVQTVTTSPTCPRGAHYPWRLVRKLAPSVIDKLATAFGSREIDYTPDPKAAPKLRELMSCNRYDLCVGRYLRPTVQSGVLEADIPVVLDVDDIDTQVYRTHLEQPGLGAAMRSLIAIHLRQLETLVPPLLRRCEHLWVCSEHDQSLLNHSSTSVLPNVVFQPSDEPLPVPTFDVENRHVVLFVGSCGHRVNLEGVLRFVKQCWPAIKAQIPDASFRIVGSGGWEDVAALREPIAGVDIIGRSDNLADEYANATCTIVPLFEGGGTKIKVIESLFFGRVPVITDAAHRGLESLPHNQALWRADDEEGLVVGCVAMLKNDRRRIEMAQCGHVIAIDQFSYNTFEQCVRKTAQRFLTKHTEGSEKQRS